MRSLPALLLLLIAAAADPQDVYAKVGGRTVIPLETRLEHTTGPFCEGVLWVYQKPGDYLNHIAELRNNCQKQNCTRPECSLSSNGSLILHRVSPQDSGLYRVITYHQSNAENTRKEFRLHVLEVLSDPDVALQCSSNDSLLVKCSVKEGTRPQILMTINGGMVGESKTGLLTVSVPSPPPWDIRCSANNEVSQKVTHVSYKVCPDPLFDPVLGVSCHPDGSVEISCAVKLGSDPLYSWIVDGEPLQNSANSSWSVHRNIITGNATSPRNVSCLARNVVNRVKTPPQVIHCQDTQTKLGAGEVYVKVALFVMYNALLVQGVLWMRTRTGPKP